MSSKNQISNMKKLVLGVICLVGSAILSSSCQKAGSIETVATPVNFDAAYVVNGQSNTISVINISSNTVDKTISLPMLQSSSVTGMMGSGKVNMWPHQISLSPDKSKMVISFPGSDFTGGSGMMLSTFTSGSMMGNLSASLQTQGKILIMDAVTGATIKELTLDGIAFNAVYSPDGKEL